MCSCVHIYTYIVCVGVCGWLCVCVWLVVCVCIVVVCGVCIVAVCGVCVCLQLAHIHGLVRSRMVS